MYLHSHCPLQYFLRIAQNFEAILVSLITADGFEELEIMGEDIAVLAKRVGAE